MKIKILTILTILILTTTFSCDGWLELLPPQGLIREEFWQSKEDVQSVVMGAYEPFASMDEKLFQFGEMRGDMVTYDNNLGESERKIMEGNIYPDNYLCDWATFYKVIDYCNEVIRNAPLVQDKDKTFTDYQMQGYLSEAYFLRGLAYFYLVRVFKDVPYVTEPTETDDADIYLPKTDGEEILRNVLDDLETYRNYATVDGYMSNAENKGRATKGSIDALMADIALWLFDYESVLQYVARIESNSAYALLLQEYYMGIYNSDYWFEIFNPGNSDESIFEFQFDENLKNSLYGLTSRYSYNYDPSLTALTIFSPDYIPEGEVQEGVRGEGGSIWKYAEDDYIIWKYIGGTGGSTSRSGVDQTSANWIVYRISDVLLMKAEALSQTGDFTGACDIVNMIRKSRGIFTNRKGETYNSVEDIIMEERQRELAFEGKRWFDLLRMGRRNDFARKNELIEIIVSNVPSTQKRILATKLSNPNGWYLPIYKYEIERNKNLEQNPYYKIQ